MRLLTIQFEDTVPPTLGKGSVVSITDGTAVMAGGKILYVTDALEEAIVVPPHEHLVTGTTVTPP